MYPALRRLERARWISGTWSPVSGRHTLRAQRAEWTEFSRLVSTVLGQGSWSEPGSC